MLLPKFDESTKQIGAILAAKAAEKPPAAGAHPLKTELLQLCRAVTAGTLDAGKLCDLLANPELLPEAARPVVQSTLADVFWFLGVEMEAGVGKEDEEIKLQPLAETRSGSAISSVTMRDGNGRAVDAVFKDGDRRKVKEERVVIIEEAG